jgi:trk system potassium uptake protein TrkA
MAIKDLDIPDSCVIAAIIRDGKIVVPRGITTFASGDEVLAVTDRSGANRLAQLLSNPNSKMVANSTNGENPA